MNSNQAQLKPIAGRVIKQRWEEKQRKRFHQITVKHKCTTEVDNTLSNISKENCDFTAQRSVEDYYTDRKTDKQI